MPRFGKHATRRLRERGISQAEAEQVIADPDITYPDPDGNPCRVKTINGRTIRVVLLASDPEFVKTVILQ